MKALYNINYHRAAMFLLPTFLRKSSLMGFLSAAIRPVTSLQEQFLNHVYETNGALEVKSQVCYLEGLINDYYDYYRRRINVRNRTINSDHFLLWKENLQEADSRGPVIIGKYNPVLLCRDGFLGSTELDFEIVFPTGFVLSENEKKQTRNLVDKHKLASKRYLIIYG